MSKKTITKAVYRSEEQLRRRLYAMGNRNAYDMSSDEVFRYFDGDKKKPVKDEYVAPQRTLDAFAKVSRTPFVPINPRTVASCKRYYEAGIAGQECKMILSQAQQYEQAVGRKIFNIDSEKLSIYAVLPRVHFGLSERNIVYIRNWYALTPQDRQVLSKYFDQRGVAYPGKSGQFIKENLPKGRQEKRMFETFNVVHGLDFEITQDGFVFLEGYADLDPDLKDLLQFYFTPDGYAKMYFQNGFMNKLGLRFREHIPSKITNREQLVSIYRKLSQHSYTAKEAKEFLLRKNPSLKTDIDKFDDVLATQLVNRYRLYAKMSTFLNEELSFVGTTSYADDIFDLSEEFEDKSEVVSTTFYKKDRFGIAVADPYAVNVNKIQWFLENAEKHCWIPEGCNSLDYISVHEFAHGLIHVYDLSRDPIIRRVEENLMEKDSVVKRVSLNAKMNTKEFIADCWSEYCISPSPRPVALRVGDRVMQFMQKKVMIL